MSRKQLTVSVAVAAALAVILLVLTTGGEAEYAADDGAPAGTVEDAAAPGYERSTDDGGVAKDGAPGSGSSAGLVGDPDQPVSSPARTTGGGTDPSGGTNPSTGQGRPEPVPQRGGQAQAGGAGAGSQQQSEAASTVAAPETAEILRATARAYEQIDAMQAGFQQRLRNTLLGTTVESAGTLYQREPDRFLMQFSDPEGDVIVSDGQYFWLYFPSSDADQVIRTRRSAQGLDLQSQFVGDPVERFEATYHGREDDRGRPTHVLSLVPREPAGYQKLKVWIDARDHLVRRFELTEGSGIVRHFTLSDLRLNPSLPDRLFQFTPPEGARVVTR